MAGVIIFAASAIWSAYQSHKQSEAAKESGQLTAAAAESQAQLSDYNAAVAELQAQDALARGAEEESRFRTQIRATVGASRNQAAAGNLDVSYGSAADTQADVAYLGELDALQIRTNAMREAWGFQVSAEDLRQRAVITRKEGVNAAAAGERQANAYTLQGVGNILGSANSLLKSRYAYSRAGQEAT